MAGVVPGGSDEDPRARPGRPVTAACGKCPVSRDCQRRQLAEQEKTTAEQVRVLKLQAEELQESLEDRERDAMERRRGQASRVYMWTKLPENDPEPAEIFAHVRNTSRQPVYDVLIQWWDAPNPYLPDDSDRPETAMFAHELMPGEELGDSSDSLGPYALCAVRFRDRAGGWWETYPDGRLKEIPLPGHRLL